MGQAKGADLLARDVRTRNDRRRDHVAARAGWFAVDLRFADAVDLQQHLLDFARVNLLACRVDQLTGAAGDGDLAVVANVDEIVGDEDALAERLKRRRVMKIAEGNVVAANGEAAAFG